MLFMYRALGFILIMGCAHLWLYTEGVLDDEVRLKESAITNEGVIMTERQIVVPGPSLEQIPIMATPAPPGLLTRVHPRARSPTPESSTPFVLRPYATGLITIADHVGASSGRAYHHNTTSWELQWESPRIFYLRNVLTDQQCDNEVDKAVLAHDAPLLQRSMCVESLSPLCDILIRVGQSVTGIHQGLGNKDDWVYVGTPGLRRYKKNQELPPHFEGSKPCGFGMNMLVWLTNVEEGGETKFPRINVSYKPRKGDGLLFYFNSESQEVDPASYHGSTMVKQGTKWIALVNFGGGNASCLLSSKRKD